jgi:ABC-2 type transport system ATP-binding protein
MMLLDAKEVTKSFGSTTAVDGLSFAVRRGEIFALLGPNGAGKTTMVRMLMDVIRPDAGQIRFFEDDHAKSSIAPHDVGYLPEDRGLYKELPVIRTLTFMGVIRGMPRSRARQAAEEWLERLDLADRAHDKLDALSKGNQQKVQFIASILHGPRLAVLDEPFSGLDPLNQELFLDILRELRDQGTTVLLSAHQMQLVERLADRVLLMNRGRCVLHGRIDEIRQESSSSGRILLVVDGAPDLDRLNAIGAVERAEVTANGEVALYVRRGEPLSGLLRAVAQETEVRSIHTEAISLHDIYVQRVTDDLDASPTEEM